MRRVVRTEDGLLRSGISIAATKLACPAPELFYAEFWTEGHLDMLKQAEVKGLVQKVIVIDTYGQDRRPGGA